MKNFFLNCLKGIAIGSGAILPGISSGVFCVILGIYEKLLNSVLNFFSDIKNNFKFLSPIFIGVIIGILFFSNILNYCLYAFPVQVKSIFIGLILGCIPSLINNVNSNKNTYKLSDLFFLVLAFIIGISCVFLESYLQNYTLNSSSINFIYLVFCGLCMSVGVIVPGVSSTIILMVLGVYNIYLSSISNMYFPVLVPIGLGILIGSFFCMKIIKYLLKRFYSQTFHLIIGFTIGSVFILLPNINSVVDIVVGLLCFIFRYIFFI